MRIRTLISLGLALLSTEALALDPACNPMIQASEARMNQPAWHSVTVVNGNFRMEHIKANGAFYKQVSGKWSKSPISFDEAERAMLAQIRNGEIKLTQCVSGGTDTVDGVPVRVFKSRIRMQGAPEEESTLYIGKSDGLPYRQVGKAVNVLYTYRNVSPPKI